MTLSTQTRSNSNSMQGIAQGLGWFSIALGVMEIAAPRTVTRTLGMRGSERLIQAYGLREIMTGVGILASRDPTPWLWGRVAGDALDLATLSSGMDEQNPRRGYVQLAMGAVAGITLLDIYAAQRMSAESSQAYGRRFVDYSDRVGLPAPPGVMRGAVLDREDEKYKAFSTPEALRPWRDGRPQNGWSEPRKGESATATGSI